MTCTTSHTWDLMLVAEKKWFKWSPCVIDTCRYEGLYSYVKALWISRNYSSWVLAWVRTTGTANSIAWIHCMPKMYLSKGIKFQNNDTSSITILIPSGHNPFGNWPNRPEPIGDEQGKLKKIKSVFRTVERPIQLEIILVSVLLSD